MEKEDLEEQEREKIERLKKEWWKAKKAKSELPILLEKRNILEKRLIKEEEEFFDLTEKKHHRKEDIEKKIEEKASMIKEIQKEKRKFDHEIDFLEEYNIKKTEKIENDFEQQLLLLFPEKLEEFQFQQSLKKKCETSLKNGKKVLLIFESLFSFLADLKLAKKKRSKLSFLSFIFGVSPSRKLLEAKEKFLQKINLAISEISSLEKDWSEQEKILEPLHRKLLKIKEVAEKQWDFHFIEKTLSPAIAPLLPLYEEWQQAEVKLLIKEEELKIKIEKWFS